MTTVITRYFESAKQAQAVKEELIYSDRLSPSIITVFTKSGDLADKLTAKNVDADTAKAYATKMSDDGAVVLVMADYKPLGVAKLTRETMTRMGAVDMGDLNEANFFKDTRKRSMKLLFDHPHMFGRPKKRKDIMTLADAVAWARPSQFFRGVVRVTRGDEIKEYNYNDEKNKKVVILPTDIVELVK